MFDGIYFEYPLVGLVLLVFLICARFCQQRQLSLFFPHIGRFSDHAFRHSWWLRLLKWLAVIMLIVTIMSPVKEQEVEVKPEEGYDIALVLDASRSMNADGFDPSNPSNNRFDVVKSIVGEFIKERVNDNMGIVVFGKYSFIATPLTYDQHILAKVVDQLYIGMAGRFTALYEAVAQSVNLLKETESKSKIAIVLTDGHNHVAGGGKVPLEVAMELAKKEGVRVYTIGIGQPHEYNGAVLSQMAEETGGAAFGAQNAAQLKQIYATIDQLEKSEIERESYVYKKYYFHFPLFLALMSLMGYLYLRNNRGMV